MSTPTWKVRVTRPVPRSSKPFKSLPTKQPTKAGPTKVAIIEDHGAVSDMLAELLLRQSEFEVVGTAADGRSGMELTLKSKPDIMVLDVMLPDISGIELLRRVRSTAPDTKVLVFSARQEPQIIRALVQEGIQGFVNKGAPLADLRDALKSLANGGTWFDDDFSHTVREALAYPARHPNTALEMLTPREREIAVLIARSHSSKEVAQLLSISIKTAENHRANLMRKLNVRDVAGLVRLIIRMGLVDPTAE